MQVVLVSSFYPPILGGAELQAQSLARELDALGVRVSVLTRLVKGSELHEHDHGIQIHRTLTALPWGPLWGLTYMSSTHRWLRRLAGQWDLVHGQQIGLHSWSSLRVAHSLGKPSLLRCSSFGAGGDLAVLRAHRFGSHLVAALRGATRVVALTRAGAEEILRYQIPADRVRVIPNGVDLRKFSAQAWPQVSEGEALRLLYVGRLSAEKGVDVLLQALIRVRSRLDFRLRIVGTGEQLPSLQARATAAGLGATVEFCGAQPDVLSHYAWSELLVLPSHFEGMPNVVLEAMACARAVLGTRVNGTEELIVEGGGGWLVPPNNPQELALALERLLAQRANLQAAGLLGRRAVEGSYSARHVASMYLREYEAMLAQRPLPSA